MVMLIDSVLAVATTLIALSGLLITFGVLRIVNLAHGELVAIGAYCASLSALSEVGTLGRCTFAFLIACVVGLALELTIVQRFYGRAQSVSLLGTWGLSLAMQESLRLCFGPAGRFVSPTSTSTVRILESDYPSYRFTVTIISLALLAALTVLFASRWGLRVRAAMDSAELAEVFGIDTRKCYRWTFVSGAGLAGVAGALLSPLVSVHSTMGVEYTTIGFIAILAGGARGLAGPLAACAALTIGRTIVLSYYGANIATLVMYVMAAILVLANCVITMGRRQLITWSE